MIGIYKITDKISGKSYVGQSMNIFSRWKEHARNIRKGKGINENGVPLKLENLTFEILELCSTEELDDREIYWIKYYDSYNNGFNKTSGGQHKRGEEKDRIEYKKQVITPIHDAKTTIYIDSIESALKNKEIVADGKHKFWCYTKYVDDILHIETLAREQGFNVLSLWSHANKKYKEFWTTEKMKIIRDIRQEGILPSQYNFVIVNDVIEYSTNIKDMSFQDWICDSTDYEDIKHFIRAGFEPERKYLLSNCRQLVSFIQNGVIPIEYYEWHTLPELRNLILNVHLYNDDGKCFKSWNEARKYFISKNMLEERTRGRPKLKQYRIRHL